MRVSKVQKVKSSEVSGFCRHEVIAGESAKNGATGITGTLIKTKTVRKLI